MSQVTNVQRVRLVRAYMRETGRICNSMYGGDWDAMPERAGLPVNWRKCIEEAGIQTTPAGASRIVTSASDEVMEAADAPGRIRNFDD